MRKAGAPSAKKIRSGKALAAIRAKSKTTALTTRRVFRTLPLSRSVGSYNTGFPKQMFMRHKFMQNFTLNNSGGTLAAGGTFQISCNGMFDPDNSGATTHQPMYYDQIQPLYRKYVVLASTCTATFYPVTSTTANTILVGGYIEDDATITPTTAVGCAEQPSAQFRFILGVPSATVVGDQFQQTNQITLRFDAKKAFGGDVIDNSQLYADNAANPTEQQFFTFFAQDGQATTALISVVNVNVIVEYSAMWFELIPNAGSN